MTARPAGEAPGWRRLAGRLARLGAVLRSLLGVPDYERYAAHMRARHPEETPLSRDEFARRRLADRYERPGSKCC